MHTDGFAIVVTNFCDYDPDTSVAEPAVDTNAPSTPEVSSAALQQPVEAQKKGFTAQVVGTGPTVRHSAMPEMFRSLFGAARDKLTITTPYDVPNEGMQSALCAAAYRGVDTTIVFPARNDSWIVGGASRGYCSELLEAGVKIYEYVGGLLHTKSLRIDGEITLIESANMDRRSFELNYENNILLCDQQTTATVFERQLDYIKHSSRVSLKAVESWSRVERFRDNALATLGPIF